MDRNALDRPLVLADGELQLRDLRGVARLLRQALTGPGQGLADLFKQLHLSFLLFHKDFPNFCFFRLSGKRILHKSRCANKRIHRFV